MVTDLLQNTMLWSVRKKKRPEHHTPGVEQKEFLAILEAIQLLKSLFQLPDPADSLSSKQYWPCER
jgi:hypothetical protein